MIYFHEEDRSNPFENKEELSSWMDLCIQKEKKTLGEVNIILCSDQYLLQLNKEHLQHDYFTDIITFDYCSGNLISGDLFVSLDRVEDNAEQLNLNPREELSRVFIHGILHLCGYKDKTEAEAQEIRAKEDFCLSLRNFS